jgi:hypothetical protein
MRSLLARLLSPFRWFWRNLTRVGNNADFVNAGDDVRYDPFGLSSALQRALSFNSHREYIPGIFVGVFPPFAVINVPLAWSGRKYFLARAGWRYDHGWPGYIFEATIKVLDHVTIY